MFYQSIEVIHILSKFLIRALLSLLLYPLIRVQYSHREGVLTSARYNLRFWEALFATTCRWVVSVVV